MPTREEVFTPNDFPTYTYVERTSDDSEQQLREALRTPKQVISLSGPSKSGKTVLVEKIVGAENLIKIPGSVIKKGEDFWNHVLDALAAPNSYARQNSISYAIQTSAQLRLGVPASPSNPSGDITIGASRNISNSNSGTVTNVRRGIHEVEAIVRDTNIVLFVDDFHYIPQAAQIEVAQQIKTGADRGIKFCIASVPHRSDDVVRSNHELRGRTANIDTKYWSPEDLKNIGSKGFDVLNISVPDDFVLSLAVECCGSPQLMQLVCLQLCRHLKVERTHMGILRPKLDSKDKRDILSRVSANANYTTLVRNLHQGPRTKGQKRDRFPFVDGTEGDSYRCVLLALSQDPPRLLISYSDLMDRVRKVCKNTSPISGSVQNACKQMTNIARRENSSERIVEWEERGGSGALHIIDPYFLYYIRHSGQLAELGSK